MLAYTFTALFALVAQLTLTTAAPHYTPVSLFKRQGEGETGGIGSNTTTTGNGTQVLLQLQQTAQYLAQVRNASIQANETGLRDLTRVSARLLDIAYDYSVLALATNNTSSSSNGQNDTTATATDSIASVIGGNYSGTALAAMYGLNATVNSLQLSLGNTKNANTTSAINEAQQSVAQALQVFQSSGLGSEQNGNDTTGGGAGGETSSATDTATSTARSQTSSGAFDTATSAIASVTSAVSV